MDTTALPSRYLRPQLASSLGFDKILTPVEEWPADVEAEENYHDSSQEDNDQCIVSSTSTKLDGVMLNRSGSGLSNPSSVGGVGDMESEVSSTREIDHEESSASILSGDYDTQPRRIFGLSHSMEDMINESFGLCGSSQDQQDDTGRVFEDDITKLLQGQSSNDTQDSSSQGSDDSSPFSSENVQALLDRNSSPSSPRGSLSFPSSGEGTPIRSVDKRTNPSNHCTHPQSPNSISPHRVPAKKQPNHGNSQSNQDTASLYPSRHNQSSYSEASSTANKYSRYDGNRLAESSSVEESGTVDVEGKSPSSTQDSNGTITEGDNGVEQPTSDVAMENQPKLNSNSKERAEKVGQTREDSIGGNLKHSQLLKETHRQTDSGIEEASIHEISKGEDCRMSGINDDEEVPLPDDSEHSKSLSYAALFTSCESGLDSPDADSIDEHSKSNHQDSADDSYLKQEPHVELFTVPNDGPPKPVPYRNRMSQTSLSSDGSYDMGPAFAELEDRRSSTTAPRSLEGPSFSKYARVPIRHSDSKLGILIKTEGVASRRRAESLDGISDTISEPQHERQNSSGSGTSESNLDIGTRRHQAAAVFQVEQRFKKRSLSESSSSSRDEYNVPLRAKPALRVLRITPNTEVSTLSPPAKEHALQATLSEADETSDECEVQTAKLRMMSPEIVVPQLPRLIEMPLRRSQSEDSFNQDSSSSGIVLTKVGSLYVIPEVKPHSLTIDTEGEEDPTYHHRHSQPSPSVLIDVDHTRRVSVDSFGSRSLDTSNPQSPKNKKRGRAPQFV